MINLIDKLRRDILLYKKEFFNLSIKNNVDVQLSSLVNLRYLIFSNLNIDKNFKSEIQKNNIIKQIRNFFYLKNFSSINFFGNLEKIKKSRHRNIVLSWSNKKSFNKNGLYKDNYFQISSLNKKYLWVLIHEDEVPKKIDNNIILLIPRKSNILIGLFNLIKYSLKIIIRNKFKINNILHQFSYDSFLANFIRDFFIDNNLFERIKSLHVPLESQPFQNTLIHLARKKKILTIGYDHTCNPFPFYNNYSKISPDKLMVHSNCSLKFYTKILNWPNKKVKKIPSVRFNKRKKSFYSNKLFLPIMINNFNKILSRLEILFRDHSKSFDTSKLKICLHPATKNLKKFKHFENKIIELQKKYSKKVTNNRTALFSIHVGNTSTIIESLEHGLEAIHVISSDFFDFLSPNLWYSVNNVKLENHIYRYKLKSFGHCVSFNYKKKRVSL